MSCRALLMLLCVLLFGCAERQDNGVEEKAQSAIDPVARAFVFVGCNRLGRQEVQPGTSSANEPQLQQTFKDIADYSKTLGLPNPPTHLFFCGDLVNNEMRDKGQTLTSQLDAWTHEINGYGLIGTVLVPLPGNHEVLQWGNPETPNPATYPVWLNWFKTNGYDRYSGNGPRGPGHGLNPDRLASDNRDFTYSFDDGDVHFVIANTDTLSDLKPPPIGWIPEAWLASDLAAAQANSSTKFIFLFGHKPIYAPLTPESQMQDGSTNILNSPTHPMASRLQSTLEATPKFTGYLCSHAHLWDARRLMPRGTVWQVVAGNAGSPIQTNWHADDPRKRYFGFTLVTIYASGKVTATSFGRPVPSPCNAKEGVVPARPMETVTLR